MAERVSLRVNGRPVSVPDGATVAAAILAAGETGFRVSELGQPRGPLCGIGACFECRVTIDGAAHRRSCQTICRPGMEVVTGRGGAAPAVPPPRPDQAREFDVVIVGAGPAGIAAACAAAECGRSVAVVDDNEAPGGQIWRGRPPEHASTAWLDRFRRSGAAYFARTAVIDRPEDQLLLCESEGRALELRFDKLILATGARERFLPFPGWTLPNVMGAGGLQALVKSGLPVEGKRVVVAGTGPLLLAVAAYLRGCGADLAAVAEQAPWGRLARFAFALAAAPAKLAQALSLRWKLRGVPYLTGCRPVAAEGDGRLERVVLTAGGKSWSEPCDYLACGFGLVPNVELALLLGCELRNGFVAVNEWQQTSLTAVYCAGEPAGIGGADLALAAGRIAGFAAAGRPEKARALFAARSRAMRFMRAMERAFELTAGLKSAATPDTIVCRCEDVTFGRLAGHSSWRDAKLQTRCGMGPCQGRVCGPAVEFLLGWKPDSVRPPVFPASVASLTGSSPRQPLPQSAPAPPR